MKKYIVPSLILTFAVTHAASAVIRRVDDSAPGGGDGTSWTTPYNSLQAALTAASSGDEIRIGGGTYKPTTSTSDRTATFLMEDGVTVKGGYAGYGASNPDLNNPAIYITILSGDLQNNDTGPANDTSHNDNSYHVVTVPNTVGNTTELRGVTIRGGNAIDDSNNSSGGGIFIIDADPVIRDCIIDGNLAASGGGIGVSGTSSNQDAKPAFVECEVNNNMSYLGGGLHLYQCSPRLINCEVRANKAFESGSGGGFDVTGNSDIKLTNCLIVGNTADNDGGGMLIRNGWGSIVNSTYHDNEAGLDAVSGAGGALVHVAIPDNQTLTLQNVIMWENDADVGDEIYSSIGTDLVIRYSDVRGGTATIGGTTPDWDGTNIGGNVTTHDPNFVNAPTDLRLECNSPCINTGNPTTSVIVGDEFDLDADTDTTEETPDLDRVTRVQGYPKQVDMGAYEKPKAASGCVGEVTGNTCVNVEDLLAVIGAWGPCANPSICPKDIAPDPCKDSAVNVQDLLAVIANWHCGGGCTSSATFEDAQDCMDAATLVYSPYTQDWYDTVDKCLEAFENP